jgi:hypothetical protein
MCVKRSLHQVVELEHRYDEITRSLDNDGLLLVNDMIGCNRHMRWPEALDLVRRIWRLIPERCRYNHSPNEIDNRHPDLDCSTSKVSIDHFIWAGLRSRQRQLSGVHSFIDTVARLDEPAIDLGILMPTHPAASFSNRAGPCRYPGVRSPPHVVRRPDDVNRAPTAFGHAERGANGSGSTK